MTNTAIPFIKDYSEAEFEVFLTELVEAQALEYLLLGALTKIAEVTDEAKEKENIAEQSKDCLERLTDIKEILTILREPADLLEEKGLACVIKSRKSCNDILSAKNLSDRTLYKDLKYYQPEMYQKLLDLNRKWNQPDVSQLLEQILQTMSSASAARTSVLHWIAARRLNPKDATET